MQGAFDPGRVWCAEPSAAPLPPALGRGKANPARGMRLDLGTEQCTIQSSCKLAAEHPKCHVMMGFTDECTKALTKMGPVEWARAAQGEDSAVALYAFLQGLVSPAPCGLYCMYSHERRTCLGHDVNWSCRAMTKDTPAMPGASLGMGAVGSKERGFLHG